MTDYLAYIQSYVAERDSLAAKKIRSNLKRVDDRHEKLANAFFSKYESCLQQRNLTFDYGIDCYLKLIGDMMEQRMTFVSTGRYANDSFEAVNKAVYANAKVMEYHMHGLALAQFLWPDQYERYTFFRDNFSTYSPVKSYLEIGGGHALYTDTAVELLPNLEMVQLIDISESSMQLAKCILDQKRVQFVLDDVFNLTTSKQYDFITIGEVIEHLEDPLAMLERVKQLLSTNGTVYLTTPANAPMIDHIFLFRDENEIRQLIHQAGFTIDKEIMRFAEPLPEEQARALNVPLMYAAFIKAMS